MIDDAEIPIATGYWLTAVIISLGSLVLKLIKLGTKVTPLLGTYLQA